MIRYELKDKSRQEALEKALPGFREALQSPETEGPMFEFTHWGNGAWRRSVYADQQNEIEAARFRPWDEEDAK